MITDFDVTASVTVRIHLDPAKFTEEFMAEFRESFFNFHSLEEHARHIGRLYATGLIEEGDFIEGYGLPDEMGITVKWVGEEVDIDRAELENSD